MDISKKPNNERRFIDWIIAALGILLAILLFFLVRQYQTLRRGEIVSARESWLMNALKDHHHLTASDTDVIRSWMTFDYLNTLFDLSPGYLKNQLSISDPAYPKLTIGKFAKDIKQPASSTLMEVQSAVRQYLENLAPANTSST
jgi:hypothetical protein